MGKDPCDYTGPTQLILTLNSICSFHFPLPRHLKSSQALGIKTRTSLGGHYSASKWSLNVSLALFHDASIPSTPLHCTSQILSFFTDRRQNPLPAKKIKTSFVAILALLPWSGTEPTISLRDACILPMVAKNQTVSS